MLQRQLQSLDSKFCFPARWLVFRRRRVTAAISFLSTFRAFRRANRHCCSKRRRWWIWPVGSQPGANADAAVLAGMHSASNADAQVAQLLSSVAGYDVNLAASLVGFAVARVGEEIARNAKISTAHSWVRIFPSASSRWPKSPDGELVRQFQLLQCRQLSMVWCKRTSIRSCKRNCLL